MNNPFQLFLKRIQHNIAFQYKAIRLVVDAVVAVYLFVPPIIAFGFYMRHVWMTQPNYLFHVSPFFLSLLLFLITISSVFHSFYKYGDQLFLVQNKSWYYKLKQYGLVYTLFTHSIVSIGWFLLILPVLYIGLSYSWIHIALIYLFTSLSMTCTSLIKRRVAIMRNQWKKIFLSSLLLIFGACLFSYVITYESISLLAYSSFLLFVLFIVVFLRRPSSYATYFVELASYDLKIRYKYLKWILSSGEYKIPSVKNYTKVPWLFKQSNLLFKTRSAHNILVESSVKQFLRNKEYILNYIYFAGASAYPLLLMPTSGKVCYTIVMAFIYLIISKKVWQVFIADDFMKLYKWNDATQASALQKAKRVFALPFFTILSIVLLATSHSIIDFIVYALTSLVGYLIVIGLSKTAKTMKLTSAYETTSNSD